MLRSLRLYNFELRYAVQSLLNIADDVKPGCLPCRFTHARDGSTTGTCWSGKFLEVHPPPPTPELPLDPSDALGLALRPAQIAIPRHPRSTWARVAFTAIWPPMH